MPVSSTEPTEPRETLAAAERAFEAGDFATARALSSGLVSNADPEIAQRASKLRARLSIDPLQIGVLVACTLFFAWVVVRYVF
jgi:hypothetical protein